MSDSDSNEIRDYLLGKLPAEAADRFEERLFTSDDVLRATSEQQNDLIDDFLSGSLSGQEEAVFRAQMERSTTLQNKLLTHRTLLRVLEGRTEGSHRSMFVTRRGWIWVVSACVAIAAVSGGVLRQHAKPTQVQLARSSELPPALRPASPVAVPDSVFFLSASVTRGSNALPLLKVPASAKLVELQIELPVSAEVVQHWKLVDLDGRVPSLATVEETKRAGGEFYVPVKLPADALPDGDHRIRLQATAGEAPVLRRFSVRRIAGPSTHQQP